MIIKKYFLKINFILVSLFSIVTGLGTFNPLGSYGPDDMGNESSSLALIIQTLFIFSLLYIRGKKNNFLFIQRYLLTTFCIIWILSTIFHNVDALATPFFVISVKLMLCLVLFFKLPLFFLKYPRYLTWSMLLFALTTGIIATLFMGGFLTPYTQFSNGRVTIFSENANSTSTRMAFAFLFILYLVVSNPENWGKWRWSLMAIEGPLLFTILASGSRGSFIVLIIGITIYLWYIPYKNNFIKTGIICIFGSVLLISILSISEKYDDLSLFDRFVSSYETGEDGGREKLSSAALDIFLRYPLFGVGAEEFTALMRTDYGLTHTVHNLYWYVLATSGIIGFLFFSSCLFRQLLYQFRKRKHSPFAVAIFIGMLLIGGKTGGALTYIMMWYIFALAFSLTQKIKMNE